MTKILILGGSGNFGKRIAASLTAKNIPVIIAGRDHNHLQAVQATLPPQLSEIAVFDIKQELDSQLARLRPRLLINTCGPFQNADYSVARAAMAQQIHYIDLADGRDFVTGISALDHDARRHNIALISGASTVPGLSSAVLADYRPHFSSIDDLTYGISPGQQAERGLATTQGILTYVGRPLKPFPSERPRVFGWQDIYRQSYPGLGSRWMANCDIPDLDLLPSAYGLKTIRFSAGLELTPLHLGLWALSWWVRLGLPLNLPRHAASLLKASNLFNRWGSADGGMHMIMTGRDLNGKPLTLRWFIIAKQGFGPYIPTVPAIVLAEKLYHHNLNFRGAKPCLGLVSLSDYLKELKNFPITTSISRSDNLKLHE